MVVKFIYLGKEVKGDFFGCFVSREVYMYKI